ncbi:MAG: transcription-repair coupling factor, partial [Solirubrobacterales bacterium]
MKVSAALRPALLAGLLEDDRALEDRPALIVTPDDRSARDLAQSLHAYLGDRKVRSYPSRGTGYASQVTPPPHLIGLRIDALDSFGRDERTPAVVVASAIALAEAIPDASLRPAGFSIGIGEDHDLGTIAGDLAAAGYERVDQVTGRGQFAIRGGILDVFAATEDRAARVEFFGDEIDSMRWFSTFTQRSLGDAEILDLAPAAELDVEHRELAELAIAGALEDGTQPDLAEVLPIDRFRAPLDLIPESAVVILAAEEEIEPALKDHWEDAVTAMHADDAQHLYEDVARPLAERAAVVFSRPVDGAGENSDDPPLRATLAETPARNMKEAEAELQKLVTSGYRTVVAFDSRGEAERTRY